MTGFGMATRSHGEGRVVVEVRSVNARTLDVRARVADSMTDSTVWIEHEVRRRLRRGRVEVTIRWEGEGPGGFEIDVARARVALQAFAELAKQEGQAAPPVSVLATVPGVFVATSGSQPGMRETATRALDEALGALDKDRAREGAAICEELLGRVARLKASLATAKERAHLLPEAYRRRLEERLARTGVAVDGARLETELVLYADKCDVTEELSRLGTHLGHVEEILAGRAEAPEGRRLDFLLLEMLREAGTMAAKAQDASMSRDVVEMKVELERMREQVQNVE